MEPGVLVTWSPGSLDPGAGLKPWEEGGGPDYGEGVGGVCDYGV